MKSKLLAFVLSLIFICIISYLLYNQNKIINNFEVLEKSYMEKGNNILELESEIENLEYEKEVITNILDKKEEELKSILDKYQQNNLNLIQLYYSTWENAEYYDGQYKIICGPVANINTDGKPS